jgi:KDEL-tailed cysteine endopeptidase
MKFCCAYSNKPLPSPHLHNTNNTMIRRILVLLAALVWAAAAHVFTRCDTAAPVLSISNVSLLPDPPLAGKQLSLHLEGVATHSGVAAGTANLVVEAYGITVASRSFELCSLVACPVAPQFQGALTYVIPSAAPTQVELTAVVTLKDAKAQELACVKLQVQVAEGAHKQQHQHQQQHRNVRRGVSDHVVVTNDVVVSDAADASWVEQLFHAWLQQFRVHVSQDEYALRLATFADNHAMIQSHNLNGTHAYLLGHNQFSHMTNAEYKSRVLWARPAPARVVLGLAFENASSADALPASVDWVAAGAVTPVKNQEQCGSCWAFSTTGALEGAYFLKHHKLVSFSEQMLVDCDTTDSGCSGGLMDNAFDWVAQNKGLCLEAAYPYTAAGGSCQQSCAPVAGSAPAKHSDVAQTDAALLAAIAQQPVAVAIEADQSGFQFYSSGVFTAECGTNLDHGVLAVGYGPASGSSPAFYKVKNSWGASWGDKGYINIARGNNLCGILLSASFPTV